jgi:tRNA-binding protein
MSNLSFSDFEKVDIRVGQVVKTEEFPEARKPAIKLWINFGEQIGIKKSSAQIKSNYSCGELVGKTVLAVVNFAPRQIGKFMSEVLILGLPDADKNVKLVIPDGNVPLGGRLY